ncbi:hypothetical protein BU17DRAFT_98751 [Hysterangium stoloniferum]|nr:hypothetical protein BU17DRAFT_98751 [Hysterangium stoloniferum]
MPFQKLSPDARRIRTIIVALPIAGVTAYVLYKRLVLGEQQRKLEHVKGPIIPLNTTAPRPPPQPENRES